MIQCPWQKEIVIHIIVFMKDVILTNHFLDLLLLLPNLFLSILPQIHPQTSKLILFIMLNYQVFIFLIEMVVLDNTW
jgi:hypothetical protein